MDLSCIPIWDDWSFQGAQDHGVLVTPRHLVQAAHYGVFSTPGIGAMPPETRLKFLSADNEVFMATVVDNNSSDDQPDDDDPHQPEGGQANFYNGIEIPYTDIRIIEIEWDDPIEEVMAKIKPARVFPSNVTDCLSGLSSGIPIVGTDQERELHIHSWNAYGTYIGAVEPTTATPWHSWYELPVPGDSGSGVLALIGATPVVLGTWYTPQSASNISNNMDAINAILGTGYSLSEFYVG